MLGGPPPRGVGVQNLRGGKGAKKGEDPPQICGGLQSGGGEVWGRWGSSKIVGGGLKNLGLRGVPKSAGGPQNRGGRGGGGLIKGEGSPRHQWGTPNRMGGGSKKVWRGVVIFSGG